MQTQKSRADWVLGLGLLISYAYFYQGGFANQNSRFDLSLALAFEGRFTIESFHLNTVDKVLSHGLHYTEKAPLASYLALPIPWLYSRFLGLADLRLAPWVADQVLYLATILAVGAVVALSSIGFRRLLMELNPRLSVGRSVAYTASVYLGTLVFPYATVLMGHALAGALLILGLWLGWSTASHLRVRGTLNPRMGRRAAISIAIFGFAVSAEYPAAVPAVILGAWLLFYSKSPRPLLGLTWALVPAAALVLAHNTLSFGSPIAMGYGKLGGTPFETQMAVGFFGVSYPRASSLLQLLFGSYRGLLVYSPILILGIGGLIYGARSRESAARVLSRAALSAAVSILLINASYGYWQGGACFGPRHLVAAIPLLGLGLAFCQPMLGPLAGGVYWPLTLLSAAVAIVGVATHLFINEFDTNPLLNSYIKFVQENKVSLNSVDVLSGGTELIHRLRFPERYPWASWNLGEWFGLRGWWSTLPLGVFWLFLALALWRITRPMGNSDGPVT